MRLVVVTRTTRTTRTTRAAWVTRAAWIMASALLVSGPAKAQTGAGARPSALERQLAIYKQILGDWAGLSRYGSDDAELPPPAPGEARVVFLGDQIVEAWGAQGRTSSTSSTFFPGRPYINRGIEGQTTGQMLVRFRQDVIALKPKVVVIAGGTNDLTGVLGPGTEGTIADNITSMTELAKANGIRVVLSSVTPVCDCFKEQTDIRPPGKIIGLNAWIRDYAARSGSVYLNFYAGLAEGRSLKQGFTADGLMPNAAGYGVMTRLAEEAIAAALAK
jgi:lysophospholipase L1-like esterase